MADGYPRRTTNMGSTGTCSTGAHSGQTHPAHGTANKGKHSKQLPEVKLYLMHKL